MAIKRFKAYISEESTGEKLEPKAQGEKDFKAKHSIETTKHPVAGDHQFNGDRAEITEDTLVDMDKSSADMVQKLAKKLKLNVKVTKNKHGLSDVEVTGSSADMKKFMNSLPQENVQEGKVKDQMIDDSEKMSKKDFIKKYGKENADDLYEAQDEEVDEVSDFKKRELEYELRGEEPKRDPKKRVPYRTPQERIQDANKRNSKEVKKEATTITKNGNTVMADGRPLSFADWRSEVEKESGHPMQRSPEEQKQGYASYLKRANNVWEQIEEGFSTMSGSSKTSYQGLDNVKLIVRHKKEVNEEVRGSRSRNIHSIFVQRGDERFKMSENNLKAARAMARHVKNGGEPFDSVGSAINEMATEQRKLREFVRYVKKSGLVNEENESYVTLAVENIDFITTSFTKLAGVKSYANATEQVLDRTHTEVLQDDIDLEGKFTETHFDNRVANVVDSIKTAMSRKTGFERSIDTAVTTETFDQLKSLLSEDDGMEFATPYAKLGHQVGQMGNSVTNPHLGNYLSGISKKLNNGDRMSQHEYTTVKSCLLGAHQQHEVPVSVAESVEEQYEQFIEQFNIL